jgi:hypothetical protein
VSARARQQLASWQMDLENWRTTSNLFVTVDFCYSEEICARCQHKIVALKRVTEVRYKRVAIKRGGML